MDECKPLVPVTSYSFDGADAMFHIDLEAALTASGAKAGQTPILEAKAEMVCPQATYDDAAAALSTAGRSGYPFFPYNPILLEELVALCDSIVRPPSLHLPNLPIPFIPLRTSPASPTSPISPL